MPRLLVLIALSALAGCSGGDPTVGPGSVTDPTVPVDGDSLVVALAYDPGSLDPLRPGTAIAASIAELIQPGLVRRHHARGELQFEPMLATSFDARPDGATYTLPIGLVWQDGAKLTPDDAVFTYERLSDPAFRSPWARDTLVVSSLTATGELSIEAKAAQPVREALLQGPATRGIVPRHAPDEVPPLASGSFKVERWDRDDLLVLAANPAAPVTLRPHLDRVVFQVLPTYEARIEGLLHGRIDLVTGVEIHDVARIKAGDGLQLIRVPSASMLYVGYDLTDPRFSDLRVRRALTMTIDRERLIRDLYTKDGQSYGTYAIGTVSPALEGWFAREILPEPFDPTGARELLRKAGWGDANRDGIVDKGGKPFEFSLLVQGGSATLDRLSDLLVAWWGSLGVRVTVEHVPPSEMLARIEAKDYDAVLWGWPADPRLDPGQIWRTGAPYNWFGYSSKAVDRAVDDAFAATDTTVAQERVREVQRLVYADQPVTFLVWQDQLSAIDGRFQATDPDLFSLFHGIEHWYVPQAAQRWGDQTPDPRIPPAPVR